MNHAHCAFDDLAAGGDDGASLLALQHGLGNLRGIGQVRNSRFQNLHASGCQSFLDFLLQMFGDFRRVAAQ